MNKSARPRGLGRGLDALLPLNPRDMAGSGPKASLFLCAIERITPCKTQPRQHFDAAALDELTASIQSHGLLEPLVVRRLASGDRFEIVAGERRWRAAQRAGLHEVPVHVREVSDQSAFELALVENVQREDLNPIELAEALGRLIAEYSYTQESLASLLNRDRSTLANALRLLKLPEKVRQLVINGQLSEGHARALLGAPDETSMTQLAEKAVARKLSVRQIEALVRAAKSEAAGDSPAPGTPEGKSPGVRDLEGRLARRYGTRCELRDHNGKGEIVIRYSDLDELDRILEQMFAAAGALSAAGSSAAVPSAPGPSAAVPSAAGSTGATAAATGKKAAGRA
jgi:ParB family transcriptional regulator, chromosome partitioning protein